ncbi:hypothetical protein B0H13DRAFT_2347380 [Mycena leptocephala]|nr:hypothetical protein B0H13DRAFT_2347380 [Mycena leptocephala]
MVDRYSDSDVDDSPSRSAPAKKKRKKRANRRQKSRSIRKFPGDRRRIIDKAYVFLQKALAIENPWPVASESGDPSADDDEFQLIEDAWAEAIYFLELDPEDFDEISLDESNLIRSRISQFRGCVMGEADKLVGAGYGFIDIQSLDGPTPENIAEVQETNRQLVADLEGKFMFLDPKDTANTATVGRHPVFQKLLNAAFFAPKGLNRRAFYFTGHDFLPPATLGFLMTAIVCGIDRYKIGRHEIVASMQFIRKWIDEYDKDVYPANLAEERLREMLSKARKLSETPAKPDQNRRSMFPMDIFS